MGRRKLDLPARRKTKPTFCGFALLFLGALPHPAVADGPALAHLTLPERTITLTADPSIPPFDMIEQDGALLRLRFAQLHLGFPTPPILSLTIEQTQAGWIAREFTLQRTSAQYPLAFAPDALVVAQTGDEGHGPAFTIEGEAMAQSGGLVPVRVDITLRSP